jgi:hypothetical protein
MDSTQSGQSDLPTNCFINRGGGDCWSVVRES